ncbi:MAG: carboxypeptidase-like regulatory domain-containing protein [Saprospiraceae bacterium]
MKTTLFMICLSLSLNYQLLGQNHREIEGVLLSKETNEPVQFANIYNLSLQKGTLSNTDGYFRIIVDDVLDTILITCIGFKEKQLKLIQYESRYEVILEENSYLLNEVTIIPKDNSYLFDLIHKCRKTASSRDSKSKAYYELKSYKDEEQIELVEGYYNTDISGYALNNLDLKAGRIALRSAKNRFFTSLEGSRAIMMLNLLSGSDRFPKNPLELSRSSMKKNFYLRLDNKYLEGNADSVYVIEYQPKDKNGAFFEGKMWINKTKSQILKITLNCTNAKTHPFLALFQSDKVSNVNFTITQSFKELNGHAVFNQIDFIYTIDYNSRIGKEEEESYSIKTKAILYAYDFDDTFFLPIFDFNQYTPGDYCKINAMPYNDFFWRFNDEYSLNDSIDSNELFFSDSTSLTNKSLFKKNTVSKKGLFEHPYLSWSENRIKFRENFSDTLVQQNTAGYNSEKYNLAVKIFLDKNSYADSTDILTATIIDPYESYYRLPMDKQSDCFINMYFDLHEMARMELLEELKTNRNNNAQEQYEGFMRKFSGKINEFLKAVDRGTSKKEMIQYNQYIYERLGIDNIDIFKPF